MLSGETAAGQYPVEALKTMSRIAECAEQDIDYRSRLVKVAASEKESVTAAIAYATCSTAMDLNAAAVITVTMTGYTAESLSRYKPGCPIIGCTINNRVARQLNLLWGVTPLHLEKAETAEELFRNAVKRVEIEGFIKKGDRAVVTAGVPLSVAGNTNMIRVVEVE